jgi:hypothetical protein
VSVPPDGVLIVAVMSVIATIRALMCASPDLRAHMDIEGAHGEK